MTAVGAESDPRRPFGVGIAMLARSPRAAGKTRLTAGLDETTATALRTAILLDAIEAALAPGWPLSIFVTPPSDIDDVRARLDADAVLAGASDRCALEAQAMGDLSVRMTDAMARTLAAGHDVVVLVGSDAPDLPVDVLREAARAVAEPSAGTCSPRLVFGPAHDGGFHLVAARYAESTAFEGVAWSVPSVLQDVTARARAAGRDVVLAAPWHDIDTPEDLRALVARPGPGAPRTRQLAHTLTPYNGE